ncbi:unnamed protein product [Phyllotreta striolata]|uniref:Uncharacterized protein n=1 Tax=Phyllotreta striolata TaxID=444603 RepID=A0A9N9XK28_PHYSR|nr:unnamed protein product [Phyllotreta striolata]
MKLLLVSAAVAFFALTSCLPTDELEEYDSYRGIIGDIINDTINNALKNMSDPTEVKDMNLVLDKMVNGRLNISGTTISGIKSIVASVIDVDIGAQTLNMSIEMTKTLSFKTNYDMDLVVADVVPLYGKGPLSVDFTGAKLSILGKLDIQSLSNITVAEVDVLFLLDSANFDIQGLLNNPELSMLVNEALNDNLVSFIDQNNHLLSNIIGPIIKDIINSILHKKK